MRPLGVLAFRCPPTVETPRGASPRRRQPSEEPQRPADGFRERGGLSRPGDAPRGGRPAFWFSLAFLAAAIVHPQPEPPPDPGPLVTAIEVRSDAPLDESLDVENLVETEIGEPLDAERIRHTLRNLQATGSAAEIELYTQDDPARGGVVVVIVFRAVVLVEEVR